MPPKSPKQKTREELERELEAKMSKIASKERERGASALAEKLKLSFSDLKGIPIDPEALKLVSEETARASQLAVIYRSGVNALVAVVDPEKPETKKILDSLKAKGLFIKLILVSQDTIETAWRRYETIKTTESFEIGAIDIQESELDRLQAKIKTVDDLKNQLVSITVTSLLEILIAGALKTQASDIHFEPTPDGMRLRYRLDGLLHDITVLDSALGLKALSRIKVLARMKLNIHNAPQDGRFTIRQKSVAIEVRVSILPSEYGETIVMRLLDPRTIKNRLEDLGMRPDIMALAKIQLDKPNGAILTTGPTGSGKTTTLYAFVNYLNTTDMKIITVEDPIEYHIKGISQTQVDPTRGYTFASGLRAVVRQDPDIILVGEIRDLETADIALHAALTGHLVLSTIHTNDASGTIPRLIDIGIKPETIAPAISMAMGQRLVRRLCQHCKIKKTLEPEELKKLKIALDPIKERYNLPPLNEKLEIHFPGKCEECNNLGYKGRVGVYEIFVITRAMEKLIVESPTISDVRDLAVKEGMVTMVQDGYLKALDGMTSIEEIHRILG